MTNLAWDNNYCNLGYPEGEAFPQPKCALLDCDSGVLCPPYLPPVFVVPAGPPSKRTLGTGSPLTDGRCQTTDSDCLQKSSSKKSARLRFHFNTVTILAPYHTTVLRPLLLAQCPDCPHAAAEALTHALLLLALLPCSCSCRCSCCRCHCCRCCRSWWCQYVCALAVE